MGKPCRIGPHYCEVTNASLRAAQSSSDCNRSVKEAAIQPRPSGRGSAFRYVQPTDPALTGGAEGTERFDQNIGLDRPAVSRLTILPPW
jgi:hypothetical protein